MTARFNYHSTDIAGIAVIERLPIVDERGFFERLFCARELSVFTDGKPILQINRSLTSKHGTIRGLHYQRPPHAEIKLVSCLRGQILDVAVDLRAGSPTFLHWYGERLSATNQRMLVIPEGCAHGFQALSDDCEILYLNTAFHAPEAEDGVHPHDPLLAIDWPVPCVQLSARDAGWPWLEGGFSGLKMNPMSVEVAR